jgi:hypothetical protein
MSAVEYEEKARHFVKLALRTQDSIDRDRVLSKARSLVGACRGRGDTPCGLFFGKFAWPPSTPGLNRGSRRGPIH